MKSNSKVIGVVVCIVCCIGALCILPLVTTNESDSLGWTPSNVYEGVISPDNSVFTEAVLDEGRGGMSTAPRITSTGSRMFHHTGASSMSMPAGATTLSYAGASVHTSSSAMMGGTGSSISPISTSTAAGSMGGAMNGGGAIYATSGNVSRSGNAGGSILSTGGSVSSASTAHRAMSPIMSSASSTSNPSAMYASNMSNNYGTAEYGGYSGLGGSRMGIRGKQGLGGIGSNMYAEWLRSLWNQENNHNGSTPWLYDYNGTYNYHYDELYELFKTWWLGLEPGATIPEDQMADVEKAWQDFLEWMKAGEEEGFHNFRFPLPDGVGVLLVLSLLCVLFTFLRSREEASPKSSQD